VPQAGNRLAPYEQRLLDLRERVIRTIGIHTANVLMERALWEASRQHPELSLIERRDDELDFSALEQAYANRPEGEIAAAFDTLVSELLLIMARLLGKARAQRLAEELEAQIVQEGQSTTG